MELTINIIGYMAAICSLSSYIWASRRAGVSDRILFHFLNFIGASGIGANAMFYGAMPSVYLNILWVSFSIMGMTRALRRNRVKAGAY